MKKTTANLPQKEAFIEAARALGCDESEERFDAALRKIAPHRPSKPTRPASKRKEARQP